MILFIQPGLTIVDVSMDFRVMIADRVHFAKMRNRISVRMVAHASKFGGSVYW